MMSTRRYTVFSRQGEPTSPTRPDSPTLPIFVNLAPAHSNPLSLMTNHSHAQAEIVSPTHTATETLSKFSVPKTEKVALPHPHPLHCNPTYPQNSRPQIELDIHVGPDAAATLIEARRALIQRLRIKAYAKIDPHRLRTDPTWHDLKLASTSMAMLDRVEKDGRLTSDSGSIMYEIPTRDIAAENAHRRAGITGDPEARALQRANVRRAPVFCLDASVHALGALRFKQYRRMERAIAIHHQFNPANRAGAATDRCMVMNPDLVACSKSNEDDIDPHLEQMWPIEMSDNATAEDSLSSSSSSSSSTKSTPQQQILLPLVYSDQPSSSSSSSPSSTHKQQAYKSALQPPPTSSQEERSKNSQKPSNTLQTTNSSSIRTSKKSSSSSSLPLPQPPPHQPSSQSPPPSILKRHVDQKKEKNPIIMAAEFANYELDEEDSEEEDSEDEEEGGEKEYHNILRELN